jgi:hypothetical protein
MRRYILALTKGEVNKLYNLLEEKENKKRIRTTLRRKLHDAYIMVNNIIVNGGGA